jgi:HD-GYP domain-containing protein (c-di-GMP phosphodiesterase class II)
VPTPVGPLLPVLLQVPEQFDAVLLMGPHGRTLSLLERRRLDRLRGPLQSVLAALHREAVLERDLDAAAARAETGKRLRDSALAPDRFLGLLLDLAVRATSSEGGFVAVADAVGALSMRVADGLPSRLHDLDVTPATGVFDWSLADEGALLLRDPEQAALLEIRSILAVPLLGQRGPLGVVGLTTSTRPAAFTEHSLLLLGSLAEQVGLMLENERAFADFSRRYLQVLQGIAETLDARRPETVGYHRQVGQLAVVLARSLGLDSGEVAAAHEAGLIHDVGLAAVPAATRAFLSDVEHPTVGADLVEGVPVHPGIARAIATHHEWYDGWGFPGGLRGNEIPLLGRVLALASFCAEMSTGDVSRPAWAAERVLHEVQQRSGSQFDPELVDGSAAALEQALASSERTERGTP